MAVSASRSKALAGTANNSGEVADTHSVGSIDNLDFAVFAIAEITAKHANAVPPFHLVSGRPSAPYAMSQSCRTPPVLLTRLARFVRWQSLYT